jgi:hypothetical protein
MAQLLLSLRVDVELLTIAPSQGGVHDDLALQLLGGFRVGARASRATEGARDAFGQLGVLHGPPREGRGQELDGASGGPRFWMVPDTRG